MPERKHVATTAEIGAALGITTRRVQQLVDEGMPRLDRGKYDLLECLSFWFLKAAEERDKAREEQGSGLDAERERLTRAQADLAQLELSEKRGEMIPLDMHKTFVSTRIRAARVRILSLPDNLAGALENESKQAIKLKLTAWSISTLTALSQEHPNAGSGGGGSPDRNDRAAETPENGTGVGRDVGAASANQRKRVGRKKPVPAARNKRSSR